MPSLQIAIKFALSAGIIVGISEIARRSTFLSALLASLPLTSLLAFVWLYVETGDVERISSLSGSIFWLVLPSLVLFLLLPALLRAGLGFWASLAASAAATTAAYFAMIKVLGALGIDL
ncbi:MAG: hypothetical protein IPM80_20615 [Proteobacteria bacterium]|nr:hypothetical protein [Pseudomonadota bacterium]